MKSDTRVFLYFSNDVPRGLREKKVRTITRAYIQLANVSHIFYMKQLRCALLVFKYKAFNYGTNCINKKRSCIYTSKVKYYKKSLIVIQSIAFAIKFFCNI